MAQILSLLSDVFKAGLRARATLFCLLYFTAQAIIFLPEVAGSLLSSKAGLSLTVKVLVSLLGPFLSNKDLLSDLRQKSKGLIKRERRINRYVIRRLDRRSLHLP